MPADQPKKRGRPKGSKTGVKRGIPLYDPETKELRGTASILNEAIIEQICSAVASGNYYGTAAAAAGIARMSLYNWLRRGARERRHQDAGGKPNQEEQIFARFHARLEIASAEAEAKQLKIIEQAAPKVWQAAAWLLERRHPDRWALGKRQVEEEQPEEQRPWSQDDPHTWSEEQLEAYRQTGELPAGPPKER